MYKIEFLESSSVMNFIDWISDRLDQSGSFRTIHLNLPVPV